MRTFIATCLFAGAAMAGAAERPADFAYGIPLSADGKDALYEFALPAAVYRGVANAGLADVRVFNGAGDAVPYAWKPRKMTGVETAPPVTLALFPLKAEAGSTLDGLSIRVRRGGDGRTSVDVSSTGKRGGSEKRVVGYFVDLTNQERVLRALTVDWQPVPDGYAGKLRVEASDDLGTWRTLVSAAPLVSLEFAGQRLEQKRVELPGQKAKYLRLSWVGRDSGAAAPELLSVRAELMDRTLEAPREWAGFDSSRGEKPGEYLFDLRGHHPVDRLRLQLPEINTVAQVEFLARDRVEQPWRSVARGVVYRLRRGDSEIASPELTVGHSTERYWLLRVDQRGGGIGAGSPKLEAGWVPHTLVFAARGAPPFQIAYGNRGAKPGGHAIDTLIPGYRDESATQFRVAKTGAQQTINVASAQALAQQELGGEARLKEAIDWKRWILWGALILGVLVLGGMAWRLVRQLESGRSASSPGAAPKDSSS